MLELILTWSVWIVALCAPSMVHNVLYYRGREAKSIGEILHENWMDGHIVDKIGNIGMVVLGMTPLVTLFILCDELVESILAIWTKSRHKPYHQCLRDGWKSYKKVATPARW